LEIVKTFKKMQILFFCLIPVGAILLVFSIKSLKKTFSGNIILEIPFNQKSAELVIDKPGYYSIWHTGTSFRKAPVDEFRPQITERSTGSEIRLIPSIFRPNVSGFRTARMELFRFRAPAGRYTLDLVEGSGISGLESRIIDLIPAPEVDHSRYFIQVIESQPGISVVIGILLIIVSGFCLIGGLVFGILARQIFNS